MTENCESKKTVLPVTSNYALCVAVSSNLLTYGAVLSHRLQRSPYSSMVNSLSSPTPDVNYKRREREQTIRRQQSTTTAILFSFPFVLGVIQPTVWQGTTSTTKEQNENNQAAKIDNNSDPVLFSFCRHHSTQHPWQGKNLHRQWKMLTPVYCGSLEPRIQIDRTPEGRHTKVLDRRSRHKDDAFLVVQEMTLDQHGNFFESPSYLDSTSFESGSNN